MGCVGSEVDENQQMIMKLTRLKHEIDSNIQRIRGQALKEQGQLLAEFKKPKSYRALAAENGFANSIVLKINKIHSYQIVKGHIQKILNYKTHLDSEQNSKKSLIPSMSIILYSESILKDQSISNFCRAIKKKFPQIQQAKDEKIDSLIMLHHKKNQLPTTVMINQYLLKLINQESLDIAQVNQVGHNVKYG